MNTALVVAICMCLALVHSEKCPTGSKDACVHTICDSSAPLACVDTECECLVQSNGITSTTDAPPAGTTTGIACTTERDCHSHHATTCQHGSHSHCNNNGMCECVSH